MFTGIITDVGAVKSLEARGDTRIQLTTAYDTATIDIGASIACSGVCLTVVDKGGDWFAAEVSAQTLSCTNLGNWATGTRVNLERAMKIGDELGGHIVTGHVDGVGEILSLFPEGDSLKIRVSAPQNLARFIAAKGAITMDGVSLTVNEVQDAGPGCIFAVNIIPHTRENTSFSALKPESRVNLEIDILARYVARMQEQG